MRIAITGSSGFIGGHVKNKLIELGHTVDEWDFKIDRPVQDFVDFQSPNVDYVIHLAADYTHCTFKSRHDKMQ